MPLKRRITKFIEYMAFRPIVGLLQIQPLPFRIWCAERIALLLGLILKKNVKLIKRNIQHAFPDKSEEWVNEIAHENIKNMGRMMAEYMELPRMTESKYDLCIDYHPSREKTLEWFKDGGILILGHIGNWEWHGSMTARWMPGKIYAMAKRQSNPWSNKLFEKIRTAGGAKSIFTDGGIFEPIRIIKNKNMIGLVADQDAGKNGIFFNFLNRPASTFSGPAVISRVTGSRVFFAYSYREGNKLHGFIEEIEKPGIDPKKNPDEWDRQLTQIWVNRLEQVIKEHPVDYFWAHNRWKTQPSKPMDKIFV